jgi:hypothetical protein
MFSTLGKLGSGSILLLNCEKREDKPVQRERHQRGKILLANFSTFAAHQISSPEFSVDPLSEAAGTLVDGSLRVKEFLKDFHLYMYDIAGT